MRLLVFHAKWCGPCRLMAPIIEEVTKELKFPMHRLDTAISPDAKKFKVTSIPTLIILDEDDGDKEIKRHTGTMSKPKLKEWLLEK